MGSNRPPTAQVVDAVATLYLAGWHHTVIAALVDRDSSFVYRALRRAGVERR